MSVHLRILLLKFGWDYIVGIDLQRKELTARQASRSSMDFKGCAAGSLVSASASAALYAKETRSGFNTIPSWLASTLSEVSFLASGVGRLQGNAQPG